MAENNSGTEEGRPGTRRGPLIALFAVAAVVVAVAIFAIVQQPSGDPTPAESPTAEQTAGTETPSTTPAPTTSPGGEGGTDGTALPTAAVLDEPKSGQEAIDALGDKIEIVAERNGMTVDQVTNLLQTDATAHVSVTGSIYYVDTRTP
ncbi:MAG TPA: hypothetical protein VFF85_01465 [Microbacterium sp.]|jgi:hypothetical protein|nr:hypothetical protein [Microbacterium sp.]